MENFRRRFTKIKGRFSEHRRLPILGKIRLGLKVQKTRPDKSIVEYPTETDYFVCPPEVQAIHGDKPVSLPIMLLSDDIEIDFPQSYAWYGSSKGLKCRGDGEVAERLGQDGVWGEMACPCEQLKSEENPRGECTEQATLLFMLPEVNMGGLYQLTTKSFHSVVDLNSGMEYTKLLLGGRLAMVPLTLWREKRETHHDQKKQTHYTLKLAFAGKEEAVASYRQQGLGYVQQLPQLPAPIEENPKLDPADVQIEGEGEDEPMPEGARLIQPDPRKEKTAPAKFKGPQLPAYGPFGKRHLDDPAVPLDDLVKYLKSIEVEANDPLKAMARDANMLLLSHLDAEIGLRNGRMTREAAVNVPPATTTASAQGHAKPSHGAKNTAKAIDAGAMQEAEIRKLVAALVETRDGNDALWGVRRNFNVALQQLPEGHEARQNYLEELREVADRLHVKVGA